MPTISTGGSSFLPDLAKLTWTFGDADDNNDVYVTVFDVTGSGVITGLWAICTTPTHRTQFKLTIDGSLKYDTENLFAIGDGNGGVFGLIYFGTSAKLEMKNEAGGASTAKFYGIVGVQ